MTPKINICRNCNHLWRASDLNKIRVYCNISPAQNIGTMIKTPEFDAGRKPDGIVGIIIHEMKENELWNEHKKHISESQIYNHNDIFTIPQGCPYQLEHVLVNQNEI